MAITMITQSQADAAKRSIASALRQITDAGRTRGGAEEMIRQIKFCQRLGYTFPDDAQRITTWEGVKAEADATITRWESYVTDMLDFFVRGELD